MTFDEIVCFGRVEHYVVQHFVRRRDVRPAAFHPQRFTQTVVAIWEHGFGAAVVPFDVFPARSAHATHGLIRGVIIHFSADFIPDEICRAVGQRQD